MRWLIGSLLMVVLVKDIVCPPVKPTTEKPDAEEDVNFGLEYERYLKEVVSILETDEQFKKKLEESNISDIKTGEIARHLDLVSHHVRTKLDELKRQELDRLRQVQRINMRRQNGTILTQLIRQAAGLRLTRDDAKRLVSHLDHNNPHTFEIEDLAKLIKQATSDLEGIDKKRKEEFKTYELEKEHLHKEKLASLDEKQRLEEQKKWDEMQEKHKKHPKLHHPGNKDQLEEVWEESDGLSKDDFNPKTFFMLHDTNSDGVLDPMEVEALFQKELDKIYDPNAPEDDMMERYEEMNRMREHVMKEVDRNRDSLITMEEFIESTNNEEFNKDPGWKTLDEEDLFTEEELAQFEKEQEEKRHRAFGDPHAQPGEIQTGHGSVHPAVMHRPQYQAQQQFKVPQPVPPQYMQEHPNQPPRHPNQPLQHPNQPLQYLPPQPVYQQQQQQQQQQPNLHMSSNIPQQQQQFVHPHQQMRQQRAQMQQQGNQQPVQMMQQGIQQQATGQFAQGMQQQQQVPVRNPQPVVQQQQQQQPQQNNVLHQQPVAQNIQQTPQVPVPVVNQAQGNNNVPQHQEAKQMPQGLKRPVQ